MYQQKEPMITNQVHTTNDYSLFRTIDGNRNLNKLHKDRLKKSMMENYLFTSIIVNDKHEIIDGQHRYNCIKELGLPLNYIICKNYGLREVQILNQNSKTWNADDYLAGYCNMMIKDYLDYRWFKNKYKFGHNECLAILSGATSNGGTMTKTFNNGHFKIVDFQKAQMVAEKIWMMKDLYDGFLRRSFVFALLRLFEKPQFEYIEFLQKVRNNPMSMQHCSEVDQYITMIEEIYNYRRRDKINLRY